MALEDVIRKWGGKEVTPMEVYTDIFKLDEEEGWIQKDGETAGQFKANPIGYYRNEGAEKGHFRVMFSDTFEEVLKELQEADFSILNGLSYFGRRNVQEHASKMFAMIFDIDGVTDSTLGNFFSGAQFDAYPVPNYVALSGHGVHMYYVFEEPVDLFPYMKLQLKELKYALTDKIWNMYTSEEKKVQHQGLNQGFRVIGGKTKVEGVRVRAFRVNEHPFSVRQICEYVPEEKRVDEKQLFRETKMTLEQAKKKYPEWYEKVIVQNDKTRVLWDIAGKVHGDNPYALYDWWLKKVREGASYGHRYFAIMCLAIYGVKCGKTYEEVKRDAYDLIPFMNSLKEEEPFTEKDCKVALECYDARYCTFPIKDLEKISAIPIPRNKRNGRKQSVHMRRISLLRDDDYPDGSWRNKDGRPNVMMEVLIWRDAHPDGRKADCIRETGLDKKTVYKWWREIDERRSEKSG